MMVNLFIHLREFLLPYTVDTQCTDQRPHLRVSNHLSAPEDWVMGGSQLSPPEIVLS